MKIKITEFALRHFDPKFGGTKILDITPKQFEHDINNEKIHKSLSINTKNETFKKYHYYQNGIKINIQINDGYAPFCKLLAIENYTDARVGSLPITLENYQYLRSGYSARREKELPVFSRWLELPLGKPKAEWLVLVLYSKEQIDKEAEAEELDLELDFSEAEEFDADWGVVAILGQSHPNEEPMKPETMLRNALGIKEGGSGVPLDREQYLKSVDFWSVNATVK